MPSARAAEEGETPASDQTKVVPAPPVPRVMKQVFNPRDKQLVDRLDAISDEVDDVIIAFSQARMQPDQARQKFSALMNEWLNLYAQFGSQRISKTLGKVELDFYNQVNTTRQNFLQRYSSYLLGDKTAMSDGELILIDRLTDSIYQYLQPILVEENTPPAASPKSR